MASEIGRGQTRFRNRSGVVDYDIALFKLNRKAWEGLPKNVRVVYVKSENSLVESRVPRGT